MKNLFIPISQLPNYLAILLLIRKFFRLGSEHKNQLLELYFNGITKNPGWKNTKNLFFHFYTY